MLSNVRGFWGDPTFTWKYSSRVSLTSFYLLPGPQLPSDIRCGLRSCTVSIEMQAGHDRYEESVEMSVSVVLVPSIVLGLKNADIRTCVATFLKFVRLW